ncbi:hypothetical protein BESB_067840 [Besnoitia besnoiti]|uniref:Cytochrome C family oxidase assembly protein PET191 n=1 Tax=Besnoitia besnoiti TaxID=94643 RepID=A0A2A9MER0_BESBE|nr:hypothetical protein BESB_067840 [Besnoitia besnoiti]PFH34751.1 hypothetical protein BESB_067840 [Besnoitia besnoiti]
MSLPVSEDRPYRQASNSCKRLYEEMIACYQKSPCMNSGEFTFEQCRHSEDPRHVTPQCITLRKAYGQCRRNLLNPQLRLRGNMIGS